ncbi:hypothetical protein E4T50_16863, partial [Aureobasidium sp. EXF-12298]
MSTPSSSLSSSPLSARRWVSHTPLSRARPVSERSSTRRPLPSSPSPRSAPRTALSSPSSSPLSRTATWPRLRSPSATGAVVSWVPRLLLSSRRSRRPLTTPSRS